jgi:hypothetical protein
VDYDNDILWHRWNINAKKRILMETVEESDAPTMEPYYIKQDMASAGTHISSLASSSNVSTGHRSLPSTANTIKGSAPSTVMMFDCDDDGSALDFGDYNGYGESEQGSRGGGCPPLSKHDKTKLEEKEKVRYKVAIVGYTNTTILTFDFGTYFCLLAGIGEGY